MKNSRLFKILKSFSKEEMKEFEKFLKSPFFNCPKFVLKLFIILKKLYPEFKEKNISGEGLFQKLYSGRKYNELLIRRMFSDLIRLSEEFMRYRNFKQNEAFQNICLLNELTKKNLDSIILLKYKTITKEIESDLVSDPSSLLYQFQIHTEMKNSRTNKRDSLMNESYSKSVDTFSVLYLRILFFYINHIITFNIEKKNISKIAVAFYKHFNKSGFFRESETFNEKYSIYLKLINNTLLIIEDKNDRKSFNNLKQLLIENSSRFSKYERISCFAVMLRFCNYQNLNFNNEFSEESFEIHNTILIEKLFLEYSPYLQLSFCRNYIIRCISLGKINQINKFIREYNEYFSPEYKEHLIYFCRSVVNFEQKNFERSLYYISKFDLENAIFKKDLKILKMKIFYELNYLDSLLSESDSFRHFISSNVSIEYAIKAKARNFVKYTAALSKLKVIHSDNELLILKNKIEKDNKLSEKKWLLEKIKELL